MLKLLKEYIESNKEEIRKSYKCQHDHHEIVVNGHKMSLSMYDNSSQENRLNIYFTPAGASLPIQPGSPLGVYNTTTNSLSFNEPISINDAYFKDYIQCLMKEFYKTYINDMLTKHFGNVIKSDIANKTIEEPDVK